MLTLLHKVVLWTSEITDDNYSCRNDITSKKAHCEGEVIRYDESLSKRRQQRTNPNEVTHPYVIRIDGVNTSASQDVRK